MNRIKELRKSKNITQVRLAKILNIAQPTLSGYETGNFQPDNDVLLQIADFFGVSVDYLLGREENKNPVNVYDVDRLVSYEEIGTICAGYNGSVNEVPTGEIVEIPLSMISGGHKDDYFVLRVQGNSMYPRILEGDRILCKRCDSVDSGSFAVVIYDSECATVKKVNYVHGENWLELIPINPEYPTKRIEGADLEQCRVLGKVIKLIRDL
jgi:repressor LexA